MNPIFREIVDPEKAKNLDHTSLIFLILGIASSSPGSESEVGSSTEETSTPNPVADDTNQTENGENQTPEDPPTESDPPQDPPLDPDPPVTPTIILTESESTTTAIEGGAGDSYTLVLSTQPIDDVSILVTADPQVRVNGLASVNIIFTSSNWNLTQTISVSAVNDSNVEGNHSGIITHQSTSDDINYNALDIPSITVSVIDNNFQVATPVITAPSAGHHNTPQSITISTATQGATIHYTIDGSVPNTSSPVYTDPIGIWSIAGRNITIKALGTAPGGENSEIASQTVGIYSIPPLKTGAGQISGYTLTNDEDGTTQYGINRSYTDNGNGSITDNATGLIWQKCSRGQNSTNCSGTSQTLNWGSAQTYCNSLSLAGKKWRLPSVQELGSIVDYGKTVSPAIDTGFFPLTQGSQYWTSNTYSPDTIQGMGINFIQGALAKSNKDSSFFHVRCVSGVPKGYVGNFTDNGNGTVLDNSTGLVWQKCSQGQNPTDCSGTATQHNWLDGLSYCSSLSLAGITWRLPNINEIKTLVNTNMDTTPSVDPNFFPFTMDGTYRTSTTYSLGTGFAWGLLNDGLTNGSNKGFFNNFIRCVSDP